MKSLSLFFLLLCSTLFAVAQSHWKSALLMGSPESNVQKEVAHLKQLKLLSRDSSQKTHTTLTYANSETGMYNRFIFMGNMLAIYTETYKNTALNEVTSEIAEDFTRKSKDYYVNTELGLDMQIIHGEHDFTLYFKIILDDDKGDQTGT